MLVLRMILVTGEAGVVELELLQSQQIKIIHEKCMLRCRTIPLIGEAGVVEDPVGVRKIRWSLMQYPVGVRKIRWSLMSI